MSPSLRPLTVIEDGGLAALAPTPTTAPAIAAPTILQAVREALRAALPGRPGFGP